MQWFSIVAIFWLIWVISAFIVLPFGIRTHEEQGEDLIPGQADSAPANFRPGRWILYTTILATIVFALFYANYVEGWIGASDLNVFGKPQGF